MPELLGKAVTSDAEQAKQALMDAFLYAHNRTTGVRNYTFAINDMKDAAKAYCAATGVEWRAVPVHASPIVALVEHSERLAEIVNHLAGHEPPTLTTGEHR